MSNLFDAIRDFALSIPGSREEFTFEFDLPVYKSANGKIFAVVQPREEAVRISLKLAPDEVLEALTLPFVQSAPYFSKKHWVMPVVVNAAELEATLVWIARSHELVTAKPARASQKQQTAP